MQNCLLACHFKYEKYVVSRNFYISFIHFKNILGVHPLRTAVLTLFCTILTALAEVAVSVPVWTKLSQ